MATDLSVLDEVMALERADGPNANAKGQNLTPADDEGALPSKITDQSDAGWVNVYRISDGVCKPVNRNMLRTQLSKRTEDGKRAFTTDPRRAAKPVKPAYHCALHPDVREGWMDEQGIKVCTKKMRSPMEARRHFQYRHKTAWEMAEERKATAREEREQRFQERLLSIGTAQVQAEAAPEKPKKREWTPEERKAQGEMLKAARLAKQQAKAGEGG
ncbi:MAG: hypothetical protein NUW01_14190 [Gemmatimonadaceae bacterium]|nr:hypothetical protein [Gemmatimonadaceae bacterium]